MNSNKSKSLGNIKSKVLNGSELIESLKCCCEKYEGRPIKFIPKGEKSNSKEPDSNSEEPKSKFKERDNSGWSSQCKGSVLGCDFMEDHYNNKDIQMTRMKDQKGTSSDLLDLEDSLLNFGKGPKDIKNIAKNLGKQLKTMIDKKVKNKENTDENSNDGNKHVKKLKKKSEKAIKDLKDNSRKAIKDLKNKFQRVLRKPEDENESSGSSKELDEKIDEDSGIDKDEVESKIDEISEDINEIEKTNKKLSKIIKDKFPKIESIIPLSIGNIIKAHKKTSNESTDPEDSSLNSKRGPKDIKNIAKSLGKQLKTLIDKKVKNKVNTDENTNDGNKHINKFKKKSEKAIKNLKNKFQRFFPKSEDEKKSSSSSEKDDSESDEVGSKIDEISEDIDEIEKTNKKLSKIIKDESQKKLSR